MKLNFNYLPPLTAISNGVSVDCVSTAFTFAPFSINIFAICVLPTQNKSITFLRSDCFRKNRYYYLLEEAAT